MRPLELTLLLGNLSYLCWLCFTAGLPGSPWAWLPLVSALVCLCHLRFEGYRWHMLPGYALQVLILAFYPWCAAHAFRLRLTEMVWTWLGAALLTGAAGVLAGVLYPVFAFEPLTGRYRVGTCALALTDASRLDPYAQGGPRPRELMLQVWYPAQVGRRPKRARYRNGRLDHWRESNLPLVRTRSSVDAPVLPNCGPLPVILFSGPNNRFQNTFQTEELASHGFLVVALDHPYDSDVVAFPDGRTIRRRKSNVFLDMHTEESLAASTRAVTENLAVRVADAQFVLDCLSRAQFTDSGRDAARASHAPLPGSGQTHPSLRAFSGHIDLSRIGMLGHSFGGAVAAELCRLDARVRAGINLDGWLFGRAQAMGVPKPFLFLVDGTPQPSGEQMHSADGESGRMRRRSREGYLDIERSLELYGGYFAQAAGVEHMNYTDSPLFSQVKARTGAGAADARRIHRFTNCLSVAFFDTYLRGAPEETLRAAAAAFPEVRFRAVDPVACLAGRENAVCP